ncbi:M20/M25/M40 family metallo-hydrolase [Pendulispora albinea]|uniref:M20/M25/M40 family metallo-hydrolase n=1 Tax=Pendulispora albinea TaxID=2741071 RepID=A0ABZ2LXP2_9BACT
MDSIDWGTEGDRCIALLADLLRIPSVNRGTGEEGDGGESPAAERLAEFLREANIEPRIFEKKKGRACLVARVKGTGERPPILLNAHLDVVEADPTRWDHPPFGGEIHDGYLWGRGAIDMKHMAAMSACVLALLARGAAGKLDRDVIFAAVADEEAGCADGSLFLVDEHPDQVRAEYTLGEVGGFSLHLLGRTFYPIQVAEKGVCWVRATFEGNPGHGSLPDPNSAVLRMANAVSALGRARLPMHPSAPVAGFLRALAARLPLPQRGALSLLAVPAVAGAILDHLVTDPDQRRTFGALLSNTATPTLVRAGSKVNVIPGRASVDIDGRVLPGQTEASFLEELRAVLGKDATLEVLRSLPPVETTSTSPLFDHLAATIRRHAPQAVPIPFVIPGFTDAKAYTRLGSTCYGFAPVRFDPTHTDVVFSRMYHGHNERIPVDGLRWGLTLLYDAVARFCSRKNGVDAG